MKEAVEDSKKLGHDSVCIMDDTTFGFVKFEKVCKELDMKPIYGLRVFLTDKLVKSRSKYETYNKGGWIFLIAKNKKGISDLYKIYTKSTEQKYYFPRIYKEDLQGTNFLIINPIDYCIPDFKFSKKGDLATYQCITGSRGVPTKPQYAMSDDMLMGFYTAKQIKNKNSIACLINDYEIPKAGMIKYNGKLNFELECWKGLTAMGLDKDVRYEDRLSYEIDMIKSKDFQDYFMIVAEMISEAKDSMIVGPGRGSSGGSLVCYCLGITNIDPIRFGLIFERFIDINRNDFPDIDSDYPDTKRHLVLEAVKRKYKSAYQLAVVSKYMPKTVLNDFYLIPLKELL
jgi:DNA polymerase III alpha subunit